MESPSPRPGRARPRAADRAPPRGNLHQPEHPPGLFRALRRLDAWLDGRPLATYLRRAPPTRAGRRRARRRRWPGHVSGPRLAGRGSPAGERTARVLGRWTSPPSSPPATGPAVAAAAWSPRKSPAVAAASGSRPAPGEAREPSACRPRPPPSRSPKIEGNGCSPGDSTAGRAPGERNPPCEVYRSSEGGRDQPPARFGVNAPAAAACAKPSMQQAIPPSKRQTRLHPGQAAPIRERAQRTQSQPSR